MDEIAIIKQMVATADATSKLAIEDIKKLKSGAIKEFEGIGNALMDLGNMVDLFAIQLTLVTNFIIDKGLITKEEFQAKFEDTMKQIQEETKKADQEMEKVKTEKI